MFETGPSVAASLREHTRDQHSRAERTAYMASFFRGQVPQHSYADMLLMLHPVYVEIERAMQSDPWLRANFYFPELYRAQALAKDLEFFRGAQWHEHLQNNDASHKYAARVRWCATHWPIGVIAHHYTRYLGDLSGGQMIKRIVAKAYNLETQGLAFYEFPQIPSIPAFKERYRAALDQSTHDADTIDRLVDEARGSFEFNIGIFEALDKMRAQVVSS